MANAGVWKVRWVCTSPVCGCVREFDVRASIWDELEAAHTVVGSFGAAVTAILIDTNEIQGKLPTNNIMGSSVKTDKDDEIDATYALVQDIDADLGEPGDLVAAGTVHGKLGAAAVFAGHTSIKEEIIDITTLVSGFTIQGV